MGFGATDGQQRRRGWKDEVLAMTDGLGVDVAIEAVGIPATFGMATELVRPGGGRWRTSAYMENRSS
jgi:alcohol dehydrogenase